MLNRDWIARHIPHQGDMCLLDAVLSWTEEKIVCESRTHQLKSNPLRQNDRLGASIGVEYAAQAMAVHSVLIAPIHDEPRVGYLASLRGLQVHVACLDNLPGPLEIAAERLSGDYQVILYRFSLHHERQCLLEGRASIFLNPPST